MKKVILEDIENMKYLLRYKRGVVISEQTTVSDNDLENIPDETPVAKTETPAANTGTPAANTGTETPTPSIKMGVFNPRVQVLQQLLNDKFQSGLTPDGKYGPKTATAIYKNIDAIKQLKLKAVPTVGNEVKTVVQQLAPVVSSNAPDEDNSENPNNELNKK